MPLRLVSIYKDALIIVYRIFIGVNPLIIIFRKDQKIINYVNFITKQYMMEANILLVT